jgi:hypothetical protein
MMDDLVIELLAPFVLEGYAAFYLNFIFLLPSFLKRGWEIIFPFLKP